MTTSRKRQYVKTGLWSNGNTSKVPTETHRFKANGLYFETEEQARRAKDAKNLSQRLRFQVEDPSERRRILLAMVQDDGKVTTSGLIQDSLKLGRIKRLIEDGTSTSDFIIKVIDIIEGEPNDR